MFEATQFKGEKKFFNTEDEAVNWVNEARQGAVFDPDGYNVYLWQPASLFIR